MKRFYWCLSYSDVVGIDVWRQGVPFTIRKDNSAVFIWNHKWLVQYIYQVISGTGLYLFLTYLGHYRFNIKIKNNHNTIIQEAILLSTCKSWRYIPVLGNSVWRKKTKLSTALKKNKSVEQMLKNNRDVLCTSKQWKLRAGNCDCNCTSVWQKIN